MRYLSIKGEEIEFPVLDNNVDPDAFQRSMARQRDVQLNFKGEKDPT